MLAVLYDPRAVVLQKPIGCASVNAQELIWLGLGLGLRVRVRVRV